MSGSIELDGEEYSDLVAKAEMADRLARLLEEADCLMRPMTTKERRIYAEIEVVREDYKATQ